MIQSCHLALGAALLSIAAAEAPLAAARSESPLEFFEGRTETVTTVKVMMHKSFSSHSIGKGEIRPDGSLLLIQRVQDEGKKPFERRWDIRKVAPGQFSGTMSEAKGPVTVTKVGGRFHFRFRMKNNVSVDQWLTPMADGRTAKHAMTARRLGMVVARSEGTIRKLDE